MLAPFTDSGSLMHYPENQWRFTDEAHTEWERYDPDWRDVVRFEATLMLDGMRRGRSAAYFLWVDEEGRSFPMFMRDMEDLLLATTITKGRVAAVWHIRKRGQNYGVAFLEESV